MKVFIIKKYPTAHATFKVLRWLTRSFTKMEFYSYVDAVFDERR